MALSSPDLLPGAEPFQASGEGERARVGVLCVHGITATPQMTRPVAEALADQGYAVSAPLLPGHGTHWRHMARTRYLDWIRAVESTAEELAERTDRLIAFGVSLGGALVTDLAIGRPELVDGLVLVNPAYLTQDWRQRFLPAMQHAIPALQGIADDIRREGPPRELAYPVVPLKPLQSFVAQWPRIRQQLEGIEVPSLLMRSRYDKVVPHASGQYFLDHVGSADVTDLWLEESAHVATLDHDAPVVIAQTQAFVARVGGA